METPPPPHVVIIPFPAQGHVKPMFMLAELLAQARFHVTFINSQHNHARFLDQIDPSFFARFPNFQFHAIPDGLPADHSRSGAGVAELLYSASVSCKPHFKELVTNMMIRCRRRSIITGDQQADVEYYNCDPPTCIMSDGIMSFAIEVGEELHIPVLAYRGNDEDLNRTISSIPGLETVMRRRDLPSMCRLEPDHPYMQFFVTEASKMRRASALILNTFEELESPVVSHLRSIFPQVYTIGPLFDMVKSRADSPFSNSSIGSLSQPDRTCIAWLDSQPTKSVVFVSFGSIVKLTSDELMEFWYGLVNCGKPFLWVMRSDLMKDVVSEEVPPVVAKGTSERGCIVKWVPQEEVLAHPALGAFLTHSGWNSTMESIAAGVPMICWPQIADQQVNSRCISNIWNNGLDMKDMCNRKTVEKMVRDLIEGKREDVVKAAAELGSKAKESVRLGGSSYKNVDKLIADIRAMKLATSATAWEN